MVNAFDPATMLDVRAFGAVGNGVTDDSAALQRAEVAARAAGKQLYFDAGTYDLSSTLYLHSDDTLVGSPGATLEAAGTNSTALATQFAPNDNASAPAPTHNITVTGLTIAGNPSLTDPSSAGPLIVAWRASNLHFNDVTVEDTPRLGALLSNVDHSGFTNSTFENIGYTQITGADPTNDSFGEGVAFSSSDINPSDNNYVTNSSFTHIGLDAISGTEQTGFVISGNSLYNLDTLNPSFWDTKADGSAGIYLSNDNGVVAASNYISDASGNGMDIVNSSNLDIRSNLVTASGGSGIILGAVQNVDVIGNNITNNNRFINHFFFQAGITVSDNMWGVSSNTSTNIYISRNTIENTAGVTSQNWALQVNLEANPQNVTITNNNILTGNADPFGANPNGIAQAWVQPWNSVIQSASDTTGGTPWVPVRSNAAPLSVSLKGSTFVTSNGLTLSNSATLVGNADPFQTIIATENGVVLGSTTVSASGAWSISPSLHDGLHMILLSEIDAVGTIVSGSIQFDLSTVSPPLSMQVQGLPSVPSGTTITSLPTLIGSAAPDAVITLADNGLVLATSTADVSGNWTWVAKLKNGDHNLTALETDAVGNRNSASLDVVLNAPTAPVSIDVIGVVGVENKASNADTIEGTSAKFAAITVSEDGVQIGTATADSAGQWSLAASITNGTYLLSATATDLNGDVENAEILIAQDGQGVTLTSVAPGGLDPTGWDYTSRVVATNASSPGTSSGQSVSQYFSLATVTPVETTPINSTVSDAHATYSDGQSSTLNQSSTPSTAGASAGAPVTQAVAAGAVTSSNQSTSLSGGTAGFSSTMPLPALATASADVASPLLGSGGKVTDFVTEGGQSKIFEVNGPNVVWSAGADTICGAAGASTVCAEGSSLVFLGNGPATVIAGGSPASHGTSTVVGSSGALAGLASAPDAIFWGGSGGATLFGAASGVQLFATGNANNLLIAESGNQTLNGTLSSGRDTFFAGQGKDIIFPGSGQNTVVAGSGASTVVAGSGTDVFSFLAGHAGGDEMITDFDPAKDKLYFGGYGADAEKAALAFSEMTGAQSFSLSDGTRITLFGDIHLTVANILSGV